ncbi:unnamed protein product [Linum tenue]|uniref:Reverse transcriptase zinc-binding domain-containing protein n=1 Tax=Linum tenue TaxID=586396 RepID=A0AAV0QP66_9ROSI|nr:unnamed protein product [Linum tenue]
MASLSSSISPLLSAVVSATDEPNNVVVVFSPRLFRHDASHLQAGQIRPRRRYWTEEILPLVTGGAGFIGTHTTVQLLKEGFRVPKLLKELAMTSVTDPDATNSSCAVESPSSHFEFITYRRQHSSQSHRRIIGSTSFYKFVSSFTSPSSCAPLALQWKPGYLGDPKLANFQSFEADTVRLHPVPTETEPDIRVWRLSPNVVFSLRTAYELTDMVDGSILNQPIWRFIWRTPTMQRVHTFLWLLNHDRLLTNAERGHRHLIDDTSCKICGGGLETTIHVVRDCPFARATWEGLLEDEPDTTFF